MEAHASNRQRYQQWLQLTLVDRVDNVQNWFLNSRSLNFDHLFCLLRGIQLSDSVLMAMRSWRGAFWFLKYNDWQLRCRCVHTFPRSGWLMVLKLIPSLFHLASILFLLASSKLFPNLFGVCTMYVVGTDSADVSADVLDATWDGTAGREALGGATARGTNTCSWNVAFLSRFYIGVTLKQKADKRGRRDFLGDFRFPRRRRETRETDCLRFPFAWPTEGIQACEPELAGFRFRETEATCVVCGG